MSYASTNIARVVDQINSSLFLPAIQHPYVWETSQITALFWTCHGLMPIAMFWMHPPAVGMNVLRSTAQRLYAAACLVSLNLFGSCRRKRA